VSVVVVVGDQDQQGYERRGRGTSVHRKLEPMLKRPPFGFRQSIMRGSVLRAWSFH
jgi:hypothetical protein